MDRLNRWVRPATNRQPPTADLGYMEATFLIELGRPASMIGANQDDPKGCTTQAIRA